MDYTRKSEIIGALADKFNKPDTNLNVDVSNYIHDTKTLDCTAQGLDMTTLEKTVSVINDQIARFNGKRDAQSMQYIAHLIVAKKCVEDVIVRKKKSN